MSLGVPNGQSYSLGVTTLSTATKTATHKGSEPWTHEIAVQPAPEYTCNFDHSSDGLPGRKRALEYQVNGQYTLFVLFLFSI